MSDSNYKLIKIADVVRLTTIPKSSIYALQAAGRFPKSISLAKRTSAWLLSEVEDWIKERIEERDSSK